MENAIPVIIVLLVLLYALYLLPKALYFLAQQVGDLFGIAIYGFMPFPRKFRQTLEHWNPYYRGLSSQFRRRFERCVKELLYEKDWVGKGIAVTWEMKVRIAGAMAQVTLGFDGLLLLHFRRIFIFPGEYLNQRTGRRHLGEVNPGRGTIVLSWAHFQEGFAKPDDAHNVGLHEMAHALWLENGIDNGEYHFLPADQLLRWQELAQVEIDRINKGENHFFRAYAGTNQAEFFAVAVENFFERPLDFKARLPAIHATLGALLRQDPAKDAEVGIKV